MFTNWYYADYKNRVIVINDDVYGMNSISVLNESKTFDKSKLLLVRLISLLAAIKFYNLKKENVALNLYHVMSFNNKMTPNNEWSIGKQIRYYTKYLPEFLTYKDQVVKYYLSYNKNKAFW